MKLGKFVRQKNDSDRTALEEIGHFFSKWQTFWLGLGRLAELKEGQLLVGKKGYKVSRKNVSGDAEMSQTGKVSVVNNAIKLKHLDGLDWSNLTENQKNAKNNQLLCVKKTGETYSLSLISNDSSSLSSLNEGQILVGQDNASSQPKAVTISGDATLNKDGVLTIGGTGSNGQSVPIINTSKIVDQAVTIEKIKLVNDPNDNK